MLLHLNKYIYKKCLFKIKWSVYMGYLAGGFLYWNSSLIVLKPAISQCSKCMQPDQIFVAGHYVPDIIVAALIGIVTGWCTGPLMPICGHWLARSSILQFLLQLSVFGLALSSQFFPYTTSAPKRIVFQHTFHTAGIDYQKWLPSVVMNKSCEHNVLFKFL